MMDTELIERATNEFVNCCRDDDRPEELWKLVWIIRWIVNGEDYPTEDKDISIPGQVRLIAMQVIEGLLTNGALKAWFTNYPLGGSYRLERSRLQVSDTVARINREWDLLGREPSVLEIVAFTPAELCPLAEKQDPS